MQSLYSSILLRHASDSWSSIKSSTWKTSQTFEFCSLLVSDWSPYDSNTLFRKSKYLIILFLPSPLESLIIEASFIPQCTMVNSSIAWFYSIISESSVASFSWIVTSVKLRALIFRSTFSGSVIFFSERNFSMHLLK